jgi:hypothetical protein
MIAVHPTSSRENEFQLRTNNEEIQQREFERHLQTQKDEYEAIIQRHLKFIDKVLFNN